MFLNTGHRSKVSPRVAARGTGVPLEEVEEKSGSTGMVDGVAGVTAAPMDVGAPDCSCAPSEPPAL